VSSSAPVVVGSSLTYSNAAASHFRHQWSDYRSNEFEQMSFK
jgi:hypothetical protein